MEKRIGRTPERRIRARPRRIPERDQFALGDVRRIIGVDPEQVAKVLPEALAEATKERDAALGVALEPTITRTIRVVASRDSRWFGELLSPAIGAAVHKAVRAALATLMQRFNQALEESLSLRSMQWRMEARQTGRPFAEVVLLHTLVYRVEQAFLIHTDSGLVLQHVVAQGAPSADPDQVSSMLSAIDSFSREAFEPKASEVYLREFALGDLVVWIDRSAMLALALVVRGHAPRSLLQHIVETRERIQLDHRPHLEDFFGDVTPFMATRPLLEQLLLEQRTHVPKRGPVVLAVLALLVAASIITLIVRGNLQSSAEAQELAAYRQALDAEPGIVVVSAAQADGGYRVHGLRDPDAAEPAELVARLGKAAEFSFEPFYSLEPQIIEKRFRQLAEPPPGVDVEVLHGTLRLSGRAPQEWFKRAVPLASRLPGITRVDVSVVDEGEPR